MAGWESIPILYRIYSYFKKYFDLSEKEKALVTIEKQLKNLEQQLVRLKDISEENSRNYESMIGFNLHGGYIRAQDYMPSPYLDFNFSISNYSIFDFKTKKISMSILYKDYELGRIEITEELEVPHQKSKQDRARLHALHTNFISDLKTLKKEGKEKSTQIVLRDVKIDFTGDREFRKFWPHDSSFVLEIPIENINVSL